MDTDYYDSLLRATSHRMHIQILNHCGIFHWIVQGKFCKKPQPILWENPWFPVKIFRLRNLMNCWLHSHVRSSPGTWCVCHSPTSIGLPVSLCFWKLVTSMTKQIKCLTKWDLGIPRDRLVAGWIHQGAAFAHVRRPARPVLTEATVVPDGHRPHFTEIVWNFWKLLWWKAKNIKLSAMMLGNTTAIPYWVNCLGSEHLWRIVYIYYLNPTSIVADECLWTVKWLHNLRSMYLLVSFWGKMSSAKDEWCTHWDTDKRSGLYLYYFWFQHLCFDRSSLFWWIHVVFYFQRIQYILIL